MSIRYYHRKLTADDLAGCAAARYAPGRPLDDLLDVARMADERAEVTEAVFPLGRRILVACWTGTADDGPGAERAEIVRPGGYLAYGQAYGHLYVTDEANLEQFYVPGRAPG